MKVRDRLSLQFTFMFAILLMIVLAGIFILENNNRRISFYDKLEGRALIVAELYLAQDNMSQENFKEVLKKYPQTLSHEVIRIYNDSYQPVFIKEDSIHWPVATIKQVVNQKKIFFSQGDKQVVGLYYVDNSGNFVVIASAIDDSGKESMEKLAWIMSFLFLGSLFITFFLGRIFARITLSPIINIIDKVKIIRATSLNQRLEVGKQPQDEINQLSITINNLLEHLEQSFQAQQAFITNASHELKTPLTTMMGDAEISLKNERTGEEYRNTIAGIIKETERLNTILNSLLELAQVTTDNSVLQKVRLDELLWGVVDDFGNKLNPVKVEYNLPHDDTRNIIQGNARLLFIAFSNILKNAYKFSDGKTITCKLYGSENGTIVSIKDDGIGINPTDVSNIFQPFYRAQNAYGFPGSGIGLSLADKIIRLHNGKIEVLSELNKGTEFRIIF